MNTIKLKSVLNEAKEKFSDIPEDEQKKLLSWPGELPPQLSRLNDLLQKTRWLKLFDNKKRVLEMSSCLVNYDGLAKWLVYRALKVGVDNTIKDLVKYIDTPEFKYYQIRSLSGVEIESELQLSDDIKLVPFSTLPESGHKRMLESGLHFGMLGQPSAALIREKLHGRDHISSGDSRNNAQYWREEFQDALLCLTVVERIGISSLASWLTIADSVPLGGHFHYGSASLSKNIIVSIAPKKVDTTTYNKAKTIHKSFTMLTEEDREKLRIAMARLNSALLQHPSVDSAIDIRVAIESIFLSDTGGLGEHSFRVRLNAAKYLGKNPTERDELYNKFDYLYSLGSTAVHTGELKHKKREPRLILEDGYLYISKAIQKIILKGFPESWKKILLS